MKTNQITIITITAVLLFALSGCEPTDGQIVLKEPKKPVSEMTPAWRWTVNGPVDQDGNPVVLEETE